MYVQWERKDVTFKGLYKRYIFKFYDFLKKNTLYIYNVMPGRGHGNKIALQIMRQIFTSIKDQHP